jgi:hypothetical protein
MLIVGSAPIYTRAMRWAIRVLVYLSLPSVAFLWLAEIDLSTWPTQLLDSGFPPPSALDLFVEAVAYALLSAVTAAVILGLAELLTGGQGRKP